MRHFGYCTCRPSIGCKFYKVVAHSISAATKPSQFASITEVTLKKSWRNDGIKTICLPDINHWQSHHMRSCTSGKLPEKQVNIGYSALFSFHSYIIINSVLSIEMITRKQVRTKKPTACLICFSSSHEVPAYYKKRSGCHPNCEWFAKSFYRLVC